MIKSIFRLFAIATAVVLLGSQVTLAQTLERLVPNAELVGKGTFRYFFIDVYDAELYAPDGNYEPDEPHAMRIHYLIHAYKHRIINQTVKEMKKQGISQEQIDDWLPEMRRTFIDMRKGWFADFILSPNGTLTLAANGEYKNMITDPELSRAIIGLWIGDDATYINFRARLLGEK